MSAKTKTSVYFDLETTSLHKMGQILNATFTQVDREFNIVDEITVDFKISDTQIPEPYAILVNREKLLDRQSLDLVSEPEGLKKIREWLYYLTEEHTRVRLIGKNSRGFDIPYWRTSSIRAGVNPYFGFKLVYGDAQDAIQKLSLDNPDLHELLVDPERGKARFSLDWLRERLELDTEEQTHHSRDDVHLTIKLAKWMYENYELHMEDFKAYEPRGMKPFDIYVQHGYKSRNEYLERVLAFVKSDKNAHWWFDVNECRSVYFNTGSHQFFIKEKLGNDDSYRDLIDSSFSDTFPEKEQDFEENIYIVPFKSSDFFQRLANGEADDYVRQKAKDDPWVEKLAVRYSCHFRPKRTKKRIMHFQNYCKFRYNRGCDGRAMSQMIGAIEAEYESLIQKRTDSEDQEILKQWKEWVNNYSLAYRVLKRK